MSVKSRREREEAERKGLLTNTSFATGTLHTCSLYYILEHYCGRKSLPVWLPLILKIRKF